MPEWTLDVERAYAAIGAGGTGARVTAADGARGLAGLGAVASRYLAVGTPRSFAIVGDDPQAALSLEAHHTWFQPSDLRATSAAIAQAIGGRHVELAEALAADIVCIHAPLALAASQLRRGTHVNALAAVTLDDDLRQVAQIYDEATSLPALAAGLIDGRVLDELTIFLATAQLPPR